VVENGRKAAERSVVFVDVSVVVVVNQVESFLRSVVVAAATDVDDDRPGTTKQCAANPPPVRQRQVRLAMPKA